MPAALDRTCTGPSALAWSLGRGGDMCTTRMTLHKLPLAFTLKLSPQPLYTQGARNQAEAESMTSTRSRRAALTRLYHRFEPYGHTASAPAVSRVYRPMRRRLRVTARQRHRCAAKQLLIMGALRLWPVRRVGI